MLAALRGTGEAISSETLSYPAGSAPRARIIVSYPDTSMWSAPIGRSTCDESIPSAASDPRHSRPHSNPCPRRALRTTKRGGRYPLQRSHEPIAASAEPIDARYGRLLLRRRLRPRRRRPGQPAGFLQHLRAGRPGAGEEPADDEEPGEERQDHLHDVSPGLAAEGPERDRLRPHRVDRPVQHPRHQRQQPHGALLLQHRRGARPLPHATTRHLPVLAVAGDMAPGPVHRAHLRPDRLQGQDRGLLREVKSGG